MSPARLHNRQVHWLVTIVTLLVLLAPVRVALAQSADWQERRTTYFALLYPPDTEPVAEQYAQFVDGVYEEVSSVFGYQTPPPVVLRMYPTMELYLRYNPLAAQLPGVVAHAHTGRREISIALSQTDGQSDEQIVNNVRHELTHIIAADLSGDKLPTGFQEGIAQFVEHPSEELDIKMQLMQQVIAADRLLSWRDLNKPGIAYADPRIGYPESYTIVAFLIKRDGMATFRAFLDAIKRDGDYRAALRAAYGVSPDALEREWRAQLDAFVAGDYRSRSVGAYDLTRARSLLDNSEFASAITELETALASGQLSPDASREADTLLAEARAGEQVTALADQARGLLEQGQYSAALETANQGAQALSAPQQQPQRDVMLVYTRLAQQGLAAQQDIADAQTALRTMQVFKARAHLVKAYAAFTELGNEPQAETARIMLARIQQAQLVVTIGMVVVAACMIAWNIYRRTVQRGQAVPFS